MCLIDVGSGSDTRLMVRQVLEWSKRRAEEENGGEGERFGDLQFGALKELNGQVHKEMMTSKRAVNGQMLRMLCQKVRGQLQQITQESGAQIEPQKQTTLLDQILKDINQAFYASVPGAGGDDAIFVLGPKTAASSLQELLKERILKQYPNIAILPVNLTRANADALTLKINF